MTDAKVLACVDRSGSALPVADAAIWAARQMRAPLEFLHVIPSRATTDGGTPEGTDHSGAIGINAQETLLETLSAEDERRSRAAREAGRIFLNNLREHAATAGVEAVDTRQRLGDVKEAVITRQDGVRLLVTGRRNATATAPQTTPGSTVEMLVRTLHRPILTVPGPFTAPHRVMIAFDGTTLTRRGIEKVANSPLLRGLSVTLLMSGSAHTADRKQLEQAKQILENNSLTVTSQFCPGNPVTTVTQSIHDQGIQLLIMGAFSHSPLRRLFFGSRTLDLLRSAPVPVLLLR